MEIIEGPVLTDHDMRNLLFEASRNRNDPKVLQDAIRRLAHNRAHIMRQLKQIEAVVSAHQASMAMGQAGNRGDPSVKGWINQILFGVREHAAEQHLDCIQQGIAVARDAAKRQRILRNRLKATRSVLQRYEAQIEQLKREWVPVEEMESMVRRETAQIRLLLSETRNAENNAIQVAEALRVELRVAREGLENAKRSLSQGEAERGALRTELSVAHQGLEDAKRSLSQGEAERGALLADNEQLKHDLNLSGMEVERLRDAHGRQEIAQQQVTKELDSVRRELDERRLESRRMRGEIDSLKAHREQLIKAIKANVSEKQQVRSMLRDALEELHQLRRTHSEAKVVPLSDYKEPVPLQNEEGIGVSDGAETPNRTALQGATMITPLVLARAAPDRAYGMLHFGTKGLRSCHGEHNRKPTTAWSLPP